ncbi:MAG: hypothetical protein WBX25_03750 [Rhodomicrobium sp.]
MSDRFGRRRNVGSPSDSAFLPDVRKGARFQFQQAEDGAQPPKRNTQASALRDGICRLRRRANCTGATSDYKNRGCHNQTIQRDGRAALFQSYDCQAGREEQLLGAQQHPLSGFGIHRDLDRW